MTQIAPPASELQALALSKLTRVLGEVAGRRVFDEILATTGTKRLETAQDLYAFAEALAKRGGFEGALGGMLAVAAVMRGAAGRSE